MTDAADPRAAARDHCLRAIAFLQHADPSGPPPAPAPGDAGLQLRALGHGLVAAYVVPGEAEFHYLLEDDLAAAGLAPDELHANAVRRLEALALRHVEVHPYGHIHAVLMGDDFEASLLLADAFWDAHAALAPDGFVAAIPARNVLAFGNAASREARQELDDLCTRVDPAIDQPLTDVLLRRVGGRWEPLAP